MRCNSFDVPRRAGRVIRVHVERLSPSSSSRAQNGGLRSAGEHVAGERHLPLAVDAIDGRRPGAGANRDHFIETDRAALRWRARSFSRALRRCSRNCSWARTTHVVLIVAGVERGRHLAGDQRVERLFDIHHRDAQVGRARRGRSPGELPACRCAASYRCRSASGWSSSSPAADRSTAPACRDPGPG